jgi:hypothetical protein
LGRIAIQLLLCNQNPPISPVLEIIKKVAPLSSSDSFSFTTHLSSCHDVLALLPVLILAMVGLLMPLLRKRQQAFSS